MLRLAGLLTSLLSVLLLALRSPEYSPETVRDIIMTGNCSPPCWQGIRPGHTLGSEAVAILRADSRVERLDLANWDAQRQVGWLEWRWRAGHSLLNGRNTMAIFADQVQGLSLNTRIVLGDIWLSFGAPDVITKSRSGDHYTLRLDYQLLQISISLPSIACHHPLARLWHEPVVISIGAWMAEKHPSPVPQSRELTGC